MSTPARLGVGIVGCGNIAQAYARDLLGYPEVAVCGVTDLVGQRAAELAGQHQLRVYDDLDDLLADGSVHIAVNLTTHHSHSDVTARCLKAGKHVYSEKPLALRGAEGWELVQLADQAGRRLGCSPAVYLGEAQQTAMAVVRQGRLGQVRVVYADGNWGPIEAWHPAPQSFYDVGPLFDIGVYPLAIATAMLGPARRVWAYGRVARPDRQTSSGEPFTVSTPEFVTIVVELAGDCVLRLTTTFYVGTHSKQTGMEFHGDLGSVHLASWQEFDAAVELSLGGSAYQPVPLAREPYPGIEWGRGVRDFAQAIADDRPHRASGAHAAHVLEILAAAATAIDTGTPVEVTSSFLPPAPMEWS